MTTPTFWYIEYQMASQNAAGLIATDDKIAKKRRMSRRNFRSLPSDRLLEDKDYSSEDWRAAATVKNFFRKLLKLPLSGRGDPPANFGVRGQHARRAQRLYSRVFQLIIDLVPDTRKASRDVGPKDACHLTA
jgi:hypothetical protein